MKTFLFNYDMHGAKNASYQALYSAMESLGEVKRLGYSTYEITTTADYDTVCAHLLSAIDDETRAVLTIVDLESEVVTTTLHNL